jgi:multiple sugar transport system substrate-binding protein
VKRKMLALVMLLALLVAACSGGGAEEGQAETDASEGAEGQAAEGESDPAEAEEQEPVELRFSWWGSDTRHEITQEVIDRFQAEHPNITITGEFTTWNDYWDRLATTVAGGDSPDIIQHESRYLREYADRGALLDMAPYVGDLLDTDALDPAVLPSGQVEDALYGVPAGVNAYAIVADPALFEQAGVELPDDESWTWEDYEQVAAEISAATPEDVWGVQDKGYNETDLQIFARQQGYDLYDDDGLGLPVEVVEAWWQRTLDMQDSGATPPADVTAEIQAAGIEQSLLATGRGAMGQWWTNEYTTLSGLAGHELELLRYPGESEFEQPGMYLKPSMYYSVAADTEHPEEAVMFIDFLVNEMAAAEVLLSDRGLPINLDLREEVADQLEPVDQTSVDFLAELAPDLAEPPPVPPIGAGEIDALLERLNEEVLFRRLTPQEAAEQFITEAESILGSTS